MSAYYSENDPFAAAWLRELIKAGHIADGEVDERSIVDVRPDDLRGFTQCHFFAGIGGWSLALRYAGWSDARAVWTGSCPCQPFSAAGKGRGKDDARHLWPQFRRLIRQCRPAVVFGEQVASQAGRVWLSAVFADLEALAYRAAGADLCGPSVGAFDIRQRLWFVADSLRAASERRAGSLPRAQTSVGGAWKFDGYQPDGSANGREVGELGDSDDSGSQGRLCSFVSERAGERAARPSGYAGDVGDAYRIGEASVGGVSGWTSTQPCRSPWATSDWIACRDGKNRPVEPGTFPLATGVPARVGRLRGYGNSIKPQVAAAFIEAYCEVR